MGVWNQTCMITRVPIPSAEPVRVFLLRGRVYHRAGRLLPLRSTAGASSASESWEPLGLPLTANYDDYGAAESIKRDAPLAMAERYFQRHYDVGFPRVFRVIQDEPDFCLKGKSYANDEEMFHPYSFALVPESIYSDVVAFTGRRPEQWHDPETYEPQLTTIRARIEQQIRKTMDTPSEMVTTDDPDPSVPLGWGAYLSGNGLAGAIAAMALSDEAGFKVVVDFLVFMQAVELLRTDWGPPCGQGSQAEDYDLHVARAEVAIRYCREKMRAAEAC